MKLKVKRQIRLSKEVIIPPFFPVPSDVGFPVLGVGPFPGWPWVLPLPEPFPVDGIPGFCSSFPFLDVGFGVPGGSLPPITVCKGGGVSERFNSTLMKINSKTIPSQF